MPHDVPPLDTFVAAVGTARPARRLPDVLLFIVYPLPRNLDGAGISEDGAGPSMAGIRTPFTAPLDVFQQTLSESLGLGLAV